MKALRSLALAGALVAACESEGSPLDPVWGKQPCAHCAMLVSDRRFAAQLVNDSGDRKYFDDVGCMILYVDERRAGVRRSWVYEGGSGRWVDAGGARFATGAKTPMDFGVEAQAQGPLGWEDAKKAVLAKRGAGR